MRKKTPKLKPAYSLLKTSKKKDVELTEKEPGKATGGCGVLASRAKQQRVLAGAKRVLRDQPRNALLRRA